MCAHMIKKIVLYLFILFLKLSLWFRYRVTIKGLEKLNAKTLRKPGGVIFFPNHAAFFVDPALITLAVWDKFPIRPMITEKHHKKPVINTVMKYMNAMPVADLEESATPMQRKRVEKSLVEVMDALRSGENFLFYPAGRLKSSSQEVIGGASGAQRIVQEVPEANVVLVRIKGLWGSSFSRAILGKTPPFAPVMLHGIWTVIKNLIFFVPKREVVIEFEPAPQDFPYKATRLEFNKYLENYYNKPDGLTQQEGNLPGDSLIQVPYAFWNNKVPKPYVFQTQVTENESEEGEISAEVKRTIIDKLAQISEMDPGTIKPEMNLSNDIGLDSLDMAELVAFLKEHYRIPSFPITELTTVQRLMSIAAGKIHPQRAKEEAFKIVKWPPVKKAPAQLAEGAILPEVFLNNCDRMGNAIAVADAASGILTYAQLKMRVLLIADYIRTLPGEYIGILLPASVGAPLLILATQLAGKVPVMVNWTVGKRHLETVLDLTKLQAVLTSRAFVERVENADLSIIEDKLVMLEDVRKTFGIIDKVKALLRSKMSTQKILKLFNADKISPDNKAVILFTSGTESMPKGVPLTHNNILANQRASYEVLDAWTDDVMYGILPPFHSFGFTVALFGLNAGVKTVFSPDPTNGEAVANGFEKYGVTIMIGAPTFLKNMLKAARPEQLQTMRLVVMGAEKPPPELIRMLADLGKEKSIIEGYGITECAPVICGNRKGHPKIGVGLPIPNVEILLVNPETFEPVKKGSQGMILVRGPNVFSGYLNPGLSSPFVTVNGKQWYKTGDLAEQDSDGNVTITGRLKRFIKIGAEMVSLPAIENALLEKAAQKGWHSNVEGPLLAVSSKEHPGEKPKITVFTKFDTTVDEINQTLKEAGFSNIIRVSSVIKIDQIPIMGTGKIHYRLLEEKYLGK